MELETENAVKIGILETKVMALHERFDKQERKMDSILAYVNQGKGALAVLLSGAALAGALASKLISLVFTKFSPL